MGTVHCKGGYSRAGVAPGPLGKEQDYTRLPKIRGENFASVKFPRAGAGKRGTSGTSG